MQNSEAKAADQTPASSSRGLPRVRTTPVPYWDASAASRQALTPKAPQQQQQQQQQSQPRRDVQHSTQTATTPAAGALASGSKRQLGDAQAGSTQPAAGHTPAKLPRHTADAVATSARQTGSALAAPVRSEPGGTAKQRQQQQEDEQPKQQHLPDSQSKQATSGAAAQPAGKSVAAATPPASRRKPSRSTPAKVLSTSASTPVPPPSSAAAARRRTGQASISAAQAAAASPAAQCSIGAAARSPAQALSSPLPTAATAAGDAAADDDAVPSMGAPARSRGTAAPVSATTAPDSALKALMSVTAAVTSQRPKRRTAELAAERMRGTAAPIDMFKPVAESHTMRMIKLEEQDERQAAAPLLALAAGIFDSQVTAAAATTGRADVAGTQSGCVAAGGRHKQALSMRQEERQHKQQGGEEAADKQPAAASKRRKTAQSGRKRTAVQAVPHQQQQQNGEDMDEAPAATHGLVEGATQEAAGSPPHKRQARASRGASKVAAAVEQQQQVSGADASLASTRPRRKAAQVATELLHVCLVRPSTATAKAGKQAGGTGAAKKTGTAAMAAEAVPAPPEAAKPAAKRIKGRPRQASSAEPSQHEELLRPGTAAASKATAAAAAPAASGSQKRSRGRLQGNSCQGAAAAANAAAVSAEAPAAAAAAALAAAAAATAAAPAQAAAVPDLQAQASHASFGLSAQVGNTAAAKAAPVQRAAASSAAELPSADAQPGQADVVSRLSTEAARVETQQQRGQHIETLQQQQQEQQELQRQQQECQQQQQEQEEEEVYDLGDDDSPAAPLTGSAGNAPGLWAPSHRASTSTPPTFPSWPPGNTGHAAGANLQQQPHNVMAAAPAAVQAENTHQATVPRYGAWLSSDAAGYGCGPGMALGSILEEPSQGGSVAEQGGSQLSGFGSARHAAPAGVARRPPPAPLLPPSVAIKLQHESPESQQIRWMDGEQYAQQQQQHHQQQQQQHLQLEQQSHQLMQRQEQLDLQVLLLQQQRQPQQQVHGNGWALPGGGAGAGTGMATQHDMPGQQRMLGHQQLPAMANAPVMQQYQHASGLVSGQQHLASLHPSVHVQLPQPQQPPVLHMAPLQQQAPLAGQQSSHGSGRMGQQQQAQQQAQQQQLQQQQRLQQSRVQQQAPGGIADVPSEGWSNEQVRALQAAYCQVEPTHPFFWQEVARRVPGKGAADCFGRIFDSQKSPEERARMPKRRALAASALKQGAPMRGAKPTVAAARKLARNLQVEAQLQRVGTGEGGLLPGGRARGGTAAAGAGAAGGATEDSSDLMAALRHQEQADKYISSFLRRRGGWLKFQKSQQLQQRQQPAAAQQPHGAAPAAAAGTRTLSSAIGAALQQQAARWGPELGPDEDEDFEMEGEEGGPDYYFEDEDEEMTEEELLAAAGQL